MAVLQTFGLFSQLPTEIREVVWQAALPPARAVKLETEYLDRWDGRGRYDRHGTEERRHEEFQYYADVYEYNDLCYETDSDVHKSGYTFEEVYGPDDLTGFRAFYRSKEHIEDTRSIPERDLRMLVHVCARDREGRLQRQTQLHRYGFTSRRAPPIIGHAVSYDMTYYQGYSPGNCGYMSRERDVRSLIHSPNGFHRPPNALISTTGILQEVRHKPQSQLHRYSFTSSRPAPTLVHLDHQFDTKTTRRKRYYSSSGHPALLHTCVESREVAKRFGYTLAFATRHSPAQTWFNFQTDILYLERHGQWSTNELSPHHRDELQIEERKRVRRLAIHYVYLRFSMPRFVQLYKNLVELIIIVTDKIRSKRRTGQQKLTIDNLIIVYCTEAELFAPRNEFTPNRDYGFVREMPFHRSNNPDGLSFYEALARRLEQELIKEDSLTSKSSDWKFPRVRFGILTNESGMKRLQAIREQYLQSEEGRSPLNDLFESDVDDE